MQRKILFVITVVALSSFVAIAGGLPDLPTPLESTNASGWQNVKNFFGVGNKEAGPKIDSPADSLADSSGAPQDKNPSDIASTASNQDKEEDPEADDKKLDITDDFFKNIDTAIKQKNGPGPDVQAGGSGNHNSPPLQQGLPPLPTSQPAAKPLETQGGNEAVPAKDPLVSAPYSSGPPAIENMGQRAAPEEASSIPELPKIVAPTEPSPDDSNSKLKAAVISKFKEEVEKRNAERSEDEDKSLIPEVNSTSYRAPDYNEPSAGPEIVESKEQKFISDEAKVLILPNDDVVLGEITNDAFLDSMDFSSYVRVFWKYYDRKQRSKQREAIDDFIDNYDENFNKDIMPTDSAELNARLDEAFTAIDYQDVSKFIVLLKNYNILQMRDENQNALIHHAAYRGDYPVTKFLVMRGINLNAKNMRGESPLYIAQKYNNRYVAYLLDLAGALSIPE